MKIIRFRLLNSNINMMFSHVCVYMWYILLFKMRKVNWWYIVGLICIPCVSLSLQGHQQQQGDGAGLRPAHYRCTPPGGGSEQAAVCGGRGGRVALPQIQECGPDEDSGASHSERQAGHPTHRHPGPGSAWRGNNSWLNEWCPRGTAVMTENTNLSGVSCFIFFPGDMILADSKLLQTLLWIFYEIETAGWRGRNSVDKYKKNTFNRL